MWVIMITCPTTGRSISTGVFTDQSLSHLPGSMLCSDCGERHQWAISYAWLAPAAAEENAPTALHLINGVWFGPDALKAIGPAFDDAWSEIADNFGDNPKNIKDARVKLANAVLSTADEDTRDIQVLKRAALQRMGVAGYKEGAAVSRTFGATQA